MNPRDNILFMYKMGIVYKSTKNLEFRIIRVNRIRDYFIGSFYGTVKIVKI